MRISTTWAIAASFLVSSVSLADFVPPVLRISIETEPLSLDWNNYSATLDRFIVSFLMRGLLKYDASSQLICDLCLSYEVAPDGKSMSFELNPAETWSDGVKLEAQHFADSFIRLLNPKNKFRIAELKLLAKDR